MMGNKEGMKWIFRPKWENDGSAERTQALTEYCWVSGCGGQRGCVVASMICTEDVMTTIITNSGVYFTKNDYLVTRHMTI